MMELSVQKNCLLILTFNSLMTKRLIFAANVAACNSKRGIDILFTGATLERPYKNVQ